MRKLKQKTKNKGFTILEILVVLAIGALVIFGTALLSLPGSPSVAHRGINCRRAADAGGREECRQTGPG